MTGVSESSQQSSNLKDEGYIVFQQCNSSWSGDMKNCRWLFRCCFIRCAVKPRPSEAVKNRRESCVNALLYAH
ncbi:hypothetical protein ACK3F5_14160 [Photorhabdus asymbiotica UENP]